MLSIQVKRQVVDAIISTPNFLGKYEQYDGIITFLNKIWDLRNLASNDPRFKSAQEDANQHLLNNNDWSMEFLFIDRFDLLQGDEKYFITFIETVVSPSVRNSKEEILQFVAVINSIIQTTGFKLILADYFEELPVYRYRDSGQTKDLPIDIIENNIPIYVGDEMPNIHYPSFHLEYVKWDDYGNKTTFTLMYRYSSTKFRKVGEVKIMKRNTSSTLQTLSQRFLSLSDDYCSLGLRKDYYMELKEILGGDFHSFLLAIRDAAIFPKINDQFEKDPIYKASLIRSDETERLARTIRYEIEGISPNEYYKFNYTYKPPFAESAITLNFDFEYNTLHEHRVYALIGKNGTGKTRLLSSLAKSLAEKAPPSFTPRKPVYGKVFTVSYSFFDRFEIPSSDASFNYVYCGLKKADSQWKTEDDLLSEFYSSVELIKEKGLENNWYKILSNFLVSDILDSVFEITPFDYTFKVSKFNQVKKVLSSGQSVTLYMISEILSQIRFDSLILFDEPETHLHPNAISALLNTLFDLVNRFKSFCVIATHSPLIIQEIPARNIFVIERDNNAAFVRGLERESLGENLTVITQDIFGNSEMPKHFIESITRLLAMGKSYDEIVSILESDSLPITSNIKLYIKALTPVQ